MSNDIDRHNDDNAAAAIDNKAVDELVVLVKEGDKTAFDNLVRLFQKPVFNLAFRMLNDYEAAQDLVQEVFVKVFNSLNRFKGEALFSTWLYAIAVNMCRNQRRVARRKSYFEYRDDETPGDGRDSKELMVDPTPGPDVNVEHNETREAVQKVVAGLPEEFSSAIIMRDIQDMSYEQIAEISGCSMGTVKSRISRARWMVREQLEKQYPGLKP